MMKTTLALLAAIALVACGKATETATEKMIESQMSKDGTQAKVDLSGGGVKISTADASGKVSQMEMGLAKVSEADIGLPFYPGTAPKEGEMTKITTPEGSVVTVMLHSDDAPDKVAGFYRDKLKAGAQGKQFTDMNTGGSHILMLGDDKAKQFTQVTVMKNESKGSDIQIMANKGTPK
ncbi:MAG: hypothetical protein V4792_17670 [Pseudomonadota bacterium]